MNHYHNQVITKLWMLSELAYHCEVETLEEAETVLREELGESFAEAYSEIYLEIVGQPTLG